MSQVRVGVGVFVLREDGYFLVGKRRGSHGAGTYALPGGHLEYGESFEACAMREVKEEAGVDVDEVRFVTAINSPMLDEHKHYVTIFMACRWRDTLQPQNMEPNKCEGWDWVHLEEIRALATKWEQGNATGEDAKLFLPLYLFALQYKQSI